MGKSQDGNDHDKKIKNNNMTDYDWKYHVSEVQEIII